MWSIDFMHDQLADDRSYRQFNLIDDFKREELQALDTEYPLSRTGNLHLRTFFTLTIRPLQIRRIKPTKNHFYLLK